MNRGRLLIHKSLDDGLSDDERKELNELIKHDDRLKSELDELQRLKNRFNRIPQFKAPFGLKSRVIAAIEEERGSRWDFFKLLPGRLFSPRLIPVYIGLVFIMITALLLFTTGKRVVVVQEYRESLIPVQFVYISDSAKNVALVGDFNNWDSNDVFLSCQGKGMWSVTVPLRPGQYQYMYVINGTKWVIDPNASDFIDDDFGNSNALLNVTTSL